MNTNQKAKLSKLMGAASMLDSHGADLLDFHSTSILVMVVHGDEKGIDNEILELSAALRHASLTANWIDPKSDEKFTALLDSAL